MEPASVETANGGRRNSLKEGGAAAQQVDSRPAHMGVDVNEPETEGTEGMRTSFLSPVRAAVVQSRCSCREPHHQEAVVEGDGNEGKQVGKDPKKAYQDGGNEPTPERLGSKKKSPTYCTGRVQALEGSQALPSRDPQEDRSHIPLFACLVACWGSSP
jgi:hypothetical protein